MNPFRNPDELKVSETVKRLNPHLFGQSPLEVSKRKPDSQSALVKDVQPKQGRAFRLVVSIIGLRKRVIDDDNFTAGNKPLRDAIAQSLGIDDGDPRVRWEYGQHETRGKQETIVRIEVL